MLDDKPHLKAFHILLHLLDFSHFNVNIFSYKASSSDLKCNNKIQIFLFIIHIFSIL